MEDVSTRVLEKKIKNIKEGKTEKMIWCIKAHIAYVKPQKKIYYPLCQTYNPTAV